MRNSSQDEETGEAGREEQAVRCEALLGRGAQGLAQYSRAGAWLAGICGSAVPRQVAHILAPITCLAVTVHVQHQATSRHHTS